MMQKQILRFDRQLLALNLKKKFRLLNQTTNNLAELINQLIFVEDKDFNNYQIIHQNLNAYLSDEAAKSKVLVKKIWLNPGLQINFLLEITLGDEKKKEILHCTYVNSRIKWFE